MKKEANSNEMIEVRDVAASFTTNNIASFALGIDIDCFTNPENPFRKYAREIGEVNIKNGLRLLAASVAPQLLNFIYVYGYC